MATLTKQNPARAANAVTFAAGDTEGDAFVNSGSVLLMVKHTNQAGSEVTLTVTTPATVDGLAVADREIAIGAGETHLIGPFPPSTYNDGDGKVQLAWSDATDIELAVLGVTA